MLCLKDRPDSQASPSCEIGCDSYIIVFHTSINQSESINQSGRKLSRGCQCKEMCYGLAMLHYWELNNPGRGMYKGYHCELVYSVYDLQWYMTHACVPHLVVLVHGLTLSVVHLQ